MSALNKIILETKYCKCGRSFKATPESKQKTCSSYCEDRLGWRTSANYKKSELEIKRGAWRDAKIQSLEKKRRKGNIYNIWKTSHEHSIENAKLIKQTEIICYGK